MNGDEQQKDEPRDDNQEVVEAAVPVVEQVHEMVVVEAPIVEPVLVLEPEAVPAQELPPIDAPIATPEPVISSKVINDKEEIINEVEPHVDQGVEGDREQINDKEEIVKEEVPHKEQITEPEKRDPMEIAKALDHDVLEAAVRLVSLERMGKMREAKIASDKKKVAGNSNRVAKFIAMYKNGVRRTTIADKLNMSPSKVTDYLQRLIASGRIRAEGKTNDRRFFGK